MSVSLVLMNCLDAKNRINKTPTTVDTLIGTLKEGASVTDPVIVVDAADLPACNYAQIPAFNRYYYITDIINVSNRLWEIHMHVDVLYTYKNAILAAPCIIAKTASNDFNLYLPDPNFKCQQNDITAMQSFPSGFDLSADGVWYYLTFFG